MAIQKVELSLSLGYQPDGIHCPVCGLQLWDPEEFLDDLEYCHHIELAYGDVVGLLHATPEIREAFDAVDREEYDNLDALEQVIDQLEGDKRFLLVVTMGGMACGPVTDTSYYVINFQPKDEG